MDLITFKEYLKSKYIQDTFNIYNDNINTDIKVKIGEITNYSISELELSKNLYFDGSLSANSLFIQL